MSDATVSEKEKKKKTAKGFAVWVAKPVVVYKQTGTFFISRAPDTKSPFPKHLYYYKETRVLCVELLHSHFSAEFSPDPNSVQLFLSCY